MEAVRGDISIQSTLCSWARTLVLELPVVGTDAIAQWVSESAVPLLPSGDVGPSLQHTLDTDRTGNDQGHKELGGHRAGWPREWIGRVRHSSGPSWTVGDGQHRRGEGLWTKKGISCGSLKACLAEQRFVMRTGEGSLEGPSECHC